MEMLLNVANKQSLMGHYGRCETKIPREISLNRDFGRQQRLSWVEWRPLILHSGKTSV